MRSVITSAAGRTRPARMSLMLRLSPLSNSVSSGFCSSLRHAETSSTTNCDLPGCVSSAALPVALSLRDWADGALASSSRLSRPSRAPSTSFTIASPSMPQPTISARRSLVAPFISPRAGASTPVSQTPSGAFHHTAPLPASLVSAPRRSVDRSSNSSKPNSRQGCRRA